LRDVSKKVSGALAGSRDEVADDTSPPPPPEPADTVQAPAPDAQDTRGDEPVAEQEDPVTAPADTVEAPADTLEAPAPAEADGAADAPDAVCAAAVDLARAVAVEVAGDAVGDHLGVESEPSADGHVVTHSFATREPGYVGWRWAVTVARGEGLDEVTVDEVVLLPGSGSLLAPAWVPWEERVEPGDLGPGDLLPPPEHDPRLVPAHEGVDVDDLPFDLHRDLGLGRNRVLSLEGRLDAAERWFDGEAGPAAPIARQAPGRCVDCGFFVPLAGSLGRGFGACANGRAPDDGRVVALLHGCGAHSEQSTASRTAAATGMALEHDELEVIDVSALPEVPPADQPYAVEAPADAPADSSRPRWGDGGALPPSGSPAIRATSRSRSAADGRPQPSR
jgi:hypothetical protein